MFPTAMLRSTSGNVSLNKASGERAAGGVAPY